MLSCSPLPGACRELTLDSAGAGDAKVLFGPDNDGYYHMQINLVKLTNDSNKLLPNTWTRIVIRDKSGARLGRRLVASGGPQPGTALTHRPIAQGDPPAACPVSYSGCPTSSPPACCAAPCPPSHEGFAGCLPCPAGSGFVLQVDDTFVFPSAVGSFATTEAHAETEGFPCVGAACSAIPQSVTSADDLVPLYGGEMVGWSGAAAAV